MKHIIVFTFIILMIGCSAEFEINQTKTPSISDVISQTINNGAKIVCKSGGQTTFEVKAKGAVNIAGQNIVFVDEKTDSISIIQNFAGQCMVTPNKDSMATPDKEKKNG